jgi:hypothetical protein
VGDGWPCECDGAQGVADAGLVQPVQRVVGAVDPGQGLAQLVQSGRGGAVGGGEDLAEVAVQGTAGALGRGELPGDSADAASCPERRIGVDASGAQRFVDIGIWLASDDRYTESELPRSFGPAPAPRKTA